MRYVNEDGSKFTLDDYIKDGRLISAQDLFFWGYDHLDDCFTYELADEKKVFEFYSEFRRKYNSEILEKMLLQRVDEKLFQYYQTEKALDSSQLDSVMLAYAFDLNEKDIRRIANKKLYKKADDTLYEHICEKYALKEPFKYFITIDGKEYECTRTADNKILVSGFPTFYIRGYYPEPY